MMKLNTIALKLLQSRYLQEGESPTELFQRVARAVDTKKARDFLTMMENLLFLPNSPTLMNAGTSLGQLSACFVLPVEDSLESIFSALTHMALIHKSGGGTGFSFSHIRPRGDSVNGTAGVASGPLSFIEVFDKATEAIKQGGKRRGANMGVLASSHPDIVEFINRKRNGSLQNFNISVGFDAEFFQCLQSQRPYHLINPRDRSLWTTIDPDSLWRMAADAAWSTGDPGMLFLDEINRRNTVPGLGPIETTNPCGEQPLYPYESCNLGSINLTKCIRKGELDYETLRYAVRNGVEFLDAVIDINNFPLPQIQEKTLATRKIGLGIMGLAEAFILLGIPYSSEEALDTADRLMGFIQREAREKSQELGEWKGSFPAIDKSIFSGPMRNATVTTIAPTGSLHIIAGTSEGIEPLFSLTYHRIIDGIPVEVVNPLLQEYTESYQGSVDILGHMRRTGSIQDLPLSDEILDLYRTALEIPAEQHVRMQAVFQKYVDNAVSKTVNLPESVSIEDVSRIFNLARSLQCKGITIYRNRSKKNQVLYRGCDICRLE